MSYLNSAQILRVAVATGTATLIAGSGTSKGYVDGTGTAARFNDVRGVALDRASGILYVADSGNNLIRKVVIGSGVVTTLAGATTAGSADGMGTVARFNKPWGLAYDGSASLYVADQDGTTIRKIDVASTLVSTISGAYMTKGSQDGSSTTARFYAPTGLTFDGAGNLFITDGAAGTIRRLALATGQVTTFAGLYGTGTSVDGVGSAARLQLPQAIVWDGAADLYFTESYTVRKVALATADVKTVAGATFHSGNTDGAGTTARFAGPAGMAAADFGTLYLADRGNSRIRKIDLMSRQVTTFAGGAAGTGPLDGTGTAARFGQPQAVTWDGRGTLYVADTFGRVIRKIVIATAEVSTLAGTAMMSGNTDGVGAAARFTYPTGIAADGAGNVFVADSSSRLLRKIVAATGEVTTIGTAGYPPLDGTGPAARFAGVEDVVSDRAGNVYIVDSHTIRKLVVATNEVTTLAGGAGTLMVVDGVGAAASFLSPKSITYDGVGNLFISESSAGVALVRKLSMQTLAVKTVAGKSAHGVQLGALPGSLNQPRAVAVVPGFGLAISDELENSILLAHGL